jgi:hypothetical protein
MEKGQEQVQLASVPMSTSVAWLTVATVGRGSRLWRKNWAKVGKMNGTSDDSENDGAHML